MHKRVFALHLVSIVFDKHVNVIPLYRLCHQHVTPAKCSMFLLFATYVTENISTPTLTRGRRGWSSKSAAYGVL